MRLYGGGVLDPLYHFFKDEDLQEQVRQLAAWLSEFHVQGLEEGTASSDLPHLDMLANLLQRGTPTKTSLHVACALAQAFPSFQAEEGEYEWKMRFTEDEGLREMLWRALHPVDPRLKPAQSAAMMQLDSKQELQLIDGLLSEGLSPDESSFWAQQLMPQRLLEGIVQQVEFTQQRCDFSFQPPYEGIAKGLVVEVDGSQHQQTDQQYLDRKRDKALAQRQWQVLRLPTDTFADGAAQQLKVFLAPWARHPYVATCLQNIGQPLMATPQGLEALQLALVPFAVARLQRAFLEWLRYNAHRLHQERLRIAVLEWDVPCAHLAFADLQEQWRQLGLLSPSLPPLPQIDLQVFSTETFLQSPLHPTGVQPISALSQRQSADLLLDISLLWQQGLSFPVSVSEADCLSLRNTAFRGAPRRFLTNAHIGYHPLCVRGSDEQWEEQPEAAQALTYFLQHVFRKKALRPGQLPILHRALQAKPVIGLLPTGGGKSLTYQLAALLQPGICLVVDPIRSLMKDQYEGLVYQHLIDGAAYVNSALKAEEKRQAVERIARGEALFAFISPERLQIPEFRGQLSGMATGGIYFSYAVIDEAHCVSEWGHDFRTAYLQLGNNLRAYCRTKQLQHVPLFALTATASFDVLSDIQRELSAAGSELDEEALVRFESSIRPELQFHIEEVRVDAQKFWSRDWDIRKAIGTKKHEHLERLLDSIPQWLEDWSRHPAQVISDVQEGQQAALSKRLPVPELNAKDFYRDNRHAGLIFCPHKSGALGITNRFNKKQAGIMEVFAADDRLRMGLFMGSGDDMAEQSKEVTEASFQCQDDFKADKLNLMVATKAFGMGIDKPNIRYTVHLNYPSSIESFVQEAGRAGRDRHLALSTILFCDQEIKLGNRMYDNDLDVNFFFHNNAFKGVEKELLVLTELLEGGNTGERRGILEGVLSEQFAETFTCRLWEKGGHCRLYINISGKSVGYIDLLYERYAVKNDSDATYEEAETYMQAALVWIQTKRTPGQALKDWLSTTHKVDGIETALETLAAGEHNDKLSLSFTNNKGDRFKRMAQWLAKNLGPHFTEQWLWEAYDKSQNLAGFLGLIASQQGAYMRIAFDLEAYCNERDRQMGHPEGRFMKVFENFYNGYRDKIDTEKAIYRLITLGVIEDYTVDFNANLFELRLCRPSEKAYTDALGAYLRKFYADKAVETKLQQARQTEGSTLLRRYLRFLVEFVYKTIREKRRLAIGEMRSACREALDQGTGMNLFLREYIDLYFNSKYARMPYIFTDEDGHEVNASLTELTDYGRESDLELLWDFIEVVDRDTTGTSKENLKHLRGACLRMITNAPDNPLFRLLDAFALLCLEYRNPRLCTQATEQLMTGLSQYLEQGMQEQDIRTLFEQFKQALDQKIPEDGRRQALQALEGVLEEVLQQYAALRQLRRLNSELQAMNDMIYLEQ